MLKTGVERQRTDIEPVCETLSEPHRRCARTPCWCRLMDALRTIACTRPRSSPTCKKVAPELPSILCAASPPLTAGGTTRGDAAKSSNAKAASQGTHWPSPCSLGGSMMPCTERQHAAATFHGGDSLVAFGDDICITTTPSRAGTSLSRRWTLLLRPWRQLWHRVQLGKNTCDRCMRGTTATRSSATKCGKVMKGDLRPDHRGHPNWATGLHSNMGNPVPRGKATTTSVAHTPLQ